MDGTTEFASAGDDSPPPRIPLAQVLADLAASDAEAAAGELADGTALLEEMRQAAADLRAEIASRHA